MTLKSITKYQCKVSLFRGVQEFGMENNFETKEGLFSTHALIEKN